MNAFLHLIINNEISRFWEKECNNFLKNIYKNETRGDIFRTENPSAWQIPMFSQIFPMRNMGDYMQNVCKK
jgi:hypothetical protein